MSVYHFSKSRYCSCIQCPKILWLKEHLPDEFDDSVMNQSVLSTGNDVGDLAMGLFGDYTEVRLHSVMTDVFAAWTFFVILETKRLSYTKLKVLPAFTGFMSMMFLISIMF